jgi:hypothetical protein
VLPCIGSHDHSTCPARTIHRAARRIPTCNTQPRTCNTQPTTRNTQQQHATRNRQRATRDHKHTAYHVRRLPCSMRHACPCRHRALADTAAAQRGVGVERACITSRAGRRRRRYERHDTRKRRQGPEGCRSGE